MNAREEITEARCGVCGTELTPDAINPPMWGNWPSAMTDEGRERLRALSRTEPTRED